MYTEREEFWIAATNPCSSLSDVLTSDQICYIDGDVSRLPTGTFQRL
jgi:hypothetical protein